MTQRRGIGVTGACIILLGIMLVAFEVYLATTAPPQHTGTVISVNSYIGAGEISSQGLGGSNGAIGTMTYYNTTIAVKGAPDFVIQLVCNLYPVGSSIPVSEVWINSYTVAAFNMPAGCALPSS